MCFCGATGQLASSPRQVFCLLAESVVAFENQISGARTMDFAPQPCDVYEVHSSLLIPGKRSGRSDNCLIGGSWQ